MLTFLFHKGWTPSILWINKIKAWLSWHHAAMSWLTSVGQNLPGTRRATYPKYFQLKTQVFVFQFLQTQEWQQWQTCNNVHWDLSFKDVWVQYLTQKYVCSISPIWSLSYWYALVADQANGAHGLYFGDPWRNQTCLICRLTVPKSAMSQSEAASAILISCDIKSLNWYGYDFILFWPNLGVVRRNIITE